MGVKDKGQEVTDEGSENDFGTAEARRRAFYVVTEQPDPQDRSSRRTRVETDYIRWYERRQFIPTIVADAYRKWGVDAYKCGLMPACIGSYGTSVVGGIAETSEIRMAAQGRRDNAIRFLAKLGNIGNLHAIGRYAARLADMLAVNDKPVGKWFSENGYGTPHEAIIALNVVGNALAKHYGLMK